MPAPEPPSTAAGQPDPPTSTEVRVQRWRDEGTASSTDVVAEESPVALRYQGAPYVVMLATPCDPPAPRPLSPAQRVPRKDPMARR